MSIFLVDNYFFIMSISYIIMRFGSIRLLIAFDVILIFFFLDFKISSFKHGSFLFVELFRKFIVWVGFFHE